MANTHRIVSGPQTGKTTAAVALVLGYLAQGRPALYVAPSRDMARWVVSCRQLPAANVASSMRPTPRPPIPPMPDDNYRSPAPAHKRPTGYVVLAILGLAVKRQEVVS